MLLVLLLSVSLPAKSIKLAGTFDLNANNNSELLLLKGGGLQYVEIEDNGDHREIWYYHPNGDRSAAVMDAVLANINDDPNPELIAIISAPSIETDKKVPWLVVFKWTGTRFTSEPLERFDFPGEKDLLRPSNINIAEIDGKVTLSVSFGSPSRKAVIFNLSEQLGSLVIESPMIFQPDILKNGYGRVFTALFNTNDGENIAVFSPEGDIMKTAIFSSTDGKEIISDLLVLNGMQNLYAPDIWVHDISYNDDQGVLLPFENDQVLMLSFTEGELSISPSDFSGQGLFAISDTTSAQEINKVVLARIEAGLYKKLDEELSGETKIDQMTIDSLISNITKIDSAFVGDTLIIPATMDSAGGFYSFQWLVKPPVGTVFQPRTGIINWIPTSNQTGDNIFAYLSQIRLGEKLFSVSTPFGKQHNIIPILSDSLFAFKLFVKDTVVPGMLFEPDEFITLEEEIVTITVVTRDTTINRYHFDGEHLFNLDVKYDIFKNNGPAVLTTSIKSNLFLLDRSVASKLTFNRNEDPDSIITTINIIHDLKNNTLELTKSPTNDSIPQSYSPEDWNSEWYQYPEYVFNGFPSSLSMDSIGSNLEFNLGLDFVMQPYANISVTVPLGSNSYTSAFSFPNEILVKEIRVAVDLDTLGNTVVRSAFDLYGSVSATSLAGIFDLKDRIRFNKQFLEAKKLFKGAGFEKFDVSETTNAITDTVSTDTTMVDSVSTDTTSGAIKDIPVVSDTLTSSPDSLTISQPPDTLNASGPITTVNDTSNIVQSDSVAVKQEEETPPGQNDNTP
ncbi:MAG: hypothetical protein ACJZ1S_04850 [Candidatus Neomarinimicrobiota bacterium]